MLYDVSVLGIDTQTRQRIDMLKSSRLQGLYIIGATGQGKTGLIENLIIQDIEQAFSGQLGSRPCRHACRRVEPSATEYATYYTHECN